MYIGSGWLWPARHIISKNCAPRPAGSEIDLLVIHSISLPPNQFAGSKWIDDLFTNQLDPHAHPYFAQISRLQVSAHFLLDRHGHITQYVPLNLQAWHAGLSSFKGRGNCNDFSIGIELEGDEVTPYTSEQYKSLVRLTRLLREEYPAITKQRIVGHCHIAPERKSDPGDVFAWDWFYEQL
ncbi:1,6-anhydro-N-acetylmuramyl-L-alanine amidase AmpD [Halorhodospira halochloris]|uniref:1,6-anhydro-N-acetylmuramyl-L-alanine amidase AmpD n=1 Tax=Halorhodospira halochloris TaxID=1052 RepID=UPI001EE8BF53|nr:1,6-anhydro-N-acetylmuramyl-L-alanine amidase AmpD [Halorhodospira halochloris]MCG5530789.1 1,6-anhydro-N-acetylmuramyl-L-alanine amidase AmpD [Halorhodospira halochloris]MCG5549224.1 1,6-anhydro-N-acetylmuramyl-L-alanine amidase AmpD [Halorhodospira halochloris]